jgi:hypothetical protein
MKKQTKEIIKGICDAVVILLILGLLLLILNCLGAG